MKKKLWIILLLSLCLASNALAVTVSDGTTADGETYIALENDESAVDVSGTANAVITNADTPCISG